MIDEAALRPYHVVDGDDGKVEAIGLAGGGIERSWTGRAHAAAYDIRTYDEILVGIDRLARPDNGLPPTRLARHRMQIGDMLVACQSMTDENRV